MSFDELSLMVETGRITLSLRGGQLVCRGTAGALSADIRQAVSQHSEALTVWCQRADAALDKALEDEHRRAIAKTMRGAQAAA